MSEQFYRSLTIELMTTNTTLRTLVTVLYEMQPPENDSIRTLLEDELRSIQYRIDRLHDLSRPKKN